MSEGTKIKTRKPSRKIHSAKQRVRLVLEGLAGKQDIDELCRREGISRSTFDKWSKAFVEAGTKRLSDGDVDQPAAAIPDTELLRRLVEAFPGNLLISRLEDGRVLFRSPSSQALFGNPQYTRNHWMHQDERARFIERLKRDGRVENFKMTGRRPDGTAFPVQFSSSIVAYGGEEIVLSSSIDLTEFHAMQAESDIANARLRDAINALGEGFVLYDKDLKFIMANERYRETLAPYRHLMTPGTPMWKISGQAIRDGFIKIITPVDGDLPGLLEAAKVNAPSQSEIQLADGTQKIVTLSRFGDGGLAATMTDITDRRKVEVRAREMMNDIIQSLDEGISLYDSELKFVMRNSRRYEMLSEHGDKIEVGTSLGEVTRRLAATGKIALQDGETPEQWSDRIVELTKAYQRDIEIPGTDGRLYVLSVHKTELGGYLLLFKDITEQRRAREAERDANMLLKVIVEACPTTFLVSRVDDGEIIYYPPASRDRFGDIESTLEFFLKPEDRVTYLNALLPSGSLDDYPVRFRRRDGSIMQGLTSARVTDYKGEDVIVSSTRDISEQLAMEAELERQRNKAHQNEKLSALGELLAGVAHELNNPLSIVVGYSLMLQDKISDPTQKQRIERIGQAAERCAKIVKMFLAMARQGPSQIEICSLNEIMETVLDVVGSGLKTAGVRIKRDLDPCIPPVAADPDQIAQVLTNLVLNAEHALAQKDGDGILKLISRYDRRTGEVVVKVRDNGAGVAKHLQPRIFEPFFTTKEAGVGTGVGLAFSHRIIRSHGGTLSLHSVPGKGATFIVRLNAVENADETGDSGKIDRCAVRNRRVLVVDDEPGVTELVKEVLDEGGYQVETCNDPVAALELLAAQRFDAVLSDMRMPGLDGRRFREKAVAADAQYSNRIAFVTGDTMSPEVIKLFRSTSTPYLEKPIVPSDLIRLVEQLCGGNGTRS